MTVGNDLMQVQPYLVSRLVGLCGQPKLCVLLFHGGAGLVSCALGRCLRLGRGLLCSSLPQPDVRSHESRQTHTIDGVRGLQLSVLL